jgi:hypothetical protein
MPSSRWVFASLFLFAACGGTAVIDGEPADGGGGQGAQGAGGQGATGAQGGSGGVTCSAFSGQPCAADEWCDYDPNTCGGADESGVCRKRPVGCNKNFDPRCGCDGVSYDNECFANAAGWDIDELGICETPPPGLFSCGPELCSLANEYCVVFFDDTGEPPTFACQPLPPCGGPPSCLCLAMLPCGDICEGNAEQGLQLSCPGG